MLPLARRLSVIWGLLRGLIPERDRARIDNIVKTGGEAPPREMWGLTADAEADQNALLGGLA